MARTFIHAALIGLLVASAGWFGVRTWALRQAYRSLTWPRTPGVITSYDFNVNRVPLIRQISYSYEVARQTYHGTRIQFGPHGATAQDFFNGMGLRDAADAAAVAYNPRSPEQSTLLAGPSKTDFRQNLLPLPFLAVSAGLLLAFQRWQRRRED